MGNDNSTEMVALSETKEQKMESSNISSYICFIIFAFLAFFLIFYLVNLLNIIFLYFCWYFTSVQPHKYSIQRNKMNATFLLILFISLIIIHHFRSLFIFLCLILL